MSKKKKDYSRGWLNSRRGGAYFEWEIFANNDACFNISDCSRKVSLSFLSKSHSVNARKIRRLISALEEFERQLGETEE